MTDHDYRRAVIQAALERIPIWRVHNTIYFSLLYADHLQVTVYLDPATGAFNVGNMEPQPGDIRLSLDDIPDHLRPRSIVPDTPAELMGDQ